MIMKNLFYHARPAGAGAVSQPVHGPDGHHLPLESTALADAR
jgi:hypothetical protein